MEQGRFRFGRFELDDHSLDLTRDGTLVHLQAQPKHVLAHLIRHADRTVSRDELKKTIWGDQTFVDFERGLNFCISQIRVALGDDAASPTYIRTFARQGYRFIAPVEWIPASQPSAAAVAPAAPRRQRLLIALALVVVGAVPLIAYLLRTAHHPAPVVAVVRFDNETGDPGITPFSDGLTDTFVERLTSASNGRYAVIGNANVLREPRDRRDLLAIASSLRANYVILGQVQAYGGQTRVLAHLIHMPEQTHVWVMRIDHPLTNPLELEAEAAQKITDAFSPRLAAGDVSPFSARR